MYHTDVAARNVSQTLFLLAITSLSQAQVFNPGFELGSGSQTFTNWTTYGNAYRDQTRPYAGAWSLKLFGNFNGGANSTGAFQTIDFKPGRRVEATVWAMNRSADAVAGNNTAYLRISFRNAANVDLAFSESRRITASTTRDVFQRLSASLDPAPIGTTKCVVQLIFQQPSSTPNAAGSVLFDQMQVMVPGRATERITFQDEFNGSTLASHWEPMIGDGSAYGNPGWGNNELQYYTGRPENVNVSGGLLRIIARRESFGGKQYTSARLRTRGRFDFTYGRVEARIKVFAGTGLWPAFWMLPSTSKYGGWASSGEIDIIETVNAATSAHYTIHHGGPWPDNISTGSSTFLAAGWASSFHVYALEWRPDSLRWLVDGVERYRLNSTAWQSTVGSWNQRAPFDEPFHMLLNLAVGGNWPGNPNAGTPFPAELQVDYVRVTQEDGARSAGDLPPDLRRMFFGQP